MRYLALTLGAMMLVGTAACGRGAAVHRLPIQVPSGLSFAQVEDAVRVALKSDREGRGWKQAAWVVESMAPGRIVARVGVEQRSLQLAIDYSRSAVATQIVRVRERGERHDEVPDWALAWQTRLERRIREELEWMAQSSP